MEQPEEFSPLARRYRNLVCGAFPQRRFQDEDFFAGQPRLHSELEWQSKWFAGEFGRRFSTTDGRAVEIIQFGWWNHGAGPDFRECAVTVDGQRLRGSMELDLEDRDWERHRHAENPAYEDVVLHLFLKRGGGEFFTRNASHRNVPQVLLDGAVADARPAMNQPAAHPGRCSAVLRDWPRQRVESLLEAAARFRLERKAQRWRRVAAIHGWDQAAFQAVAEALGYRKNKLPMTVLAQRFPLKHLRQHPREREALLFGAAGFLDGVSFDDADTDTRTYLRSLWEIWWKRRAEFAGEAQRRPLHWNFSAVRPANHPQRRVAALGAVAEAWQTVRRCLQADSFSEKEFAKTFRALTHPYWDVHYTLTSRPSAKRLALVGAARIADLLANLAFPMLVPQREPLWSSYCQLSAPLSNEKSTLAALRLFGGTPLAEAFGARVFHQQALIQLLEDFCMVDATDCIGCPFPEQLGQWAAV